MCKHTIDTLLVRVVRARKEQSIVLWQCIERWWSKKPSLGR